MKLEAERFAEQLLSGNQSEAWAMIAGLHAAGKNSLYIYDRVITSALRYIGELWEQNQITVADEHLATATCDLIILQYSAFLNHTPTQAKKAMMLCIEGEQHDVGLKLAAQMFKEAGWETRFYGANLPLEHILTSAIQWQPHVIGLSVSIVYHLPRLSAYITTFEKMYHHPTVMVGGRLTETYDLRSYGSENTLFMRNLFEIQQWISEHGNTQTMRNVTG
ncbi:cobalamin B12-binding domain-containing protein [Paenibacillus gansuensis]|uniref:B12-binding domain-containing protein n=1 Tax=Paenibacillus gansuensis TaxID=306542 RepID=A0ABW5PD38_9BACL